MRNRKYDIEKYLRGELSPAEMHALEKEALNDPFLAEALEGIEQAGTENFLYDLHNISKSMHDRMRRNQRKKGRVIRIWGWASSAAATILLLVVSGFLVLSILKSRKATEPANESVSNANSDTVSTKDSLVAMTEEKKIDETPLETVPKDTEKSVTPPPLAKETLPPPIEHEETPIKRWETSHQPAPTARVTPPEVSPPDSTVTMEDKAVTETLRGRVAGVQAAPDVRSGSLSEGRRRFTGRVTDENGQDLPGVNVTIRGTKIFALTDSEGKYEIDALADTATLVFGYIGFETKEIPGTGEPMVVSLEEDISTLSEVVVTGYAEKKIDQTAYRYAEPDGGSAGFKQYLANNVKYPQQALDNKIQGKVTVRFTVESTGQLANFEVLKGIGSGCEEELIRAIRQGPHWKPGTMGSQRVRERVRVRYRFKLPK